MQYLQDEIQGRKTSAVILTSLLQLSLNTVGN